MLGLAWRVGGLDQRLLWVQRHDALRHSQLLLLSDVVVINGTSPAVVNVVLRSARH